MNFSKKISAGAVALALGASALVAPQARALPGEFTSPPGLNIGYETGCRATLSHSLETLQRDRNWERSETPGGVINTVRVDDRAAGTTTFWAWASLEERAQRLQRFNEVTLEVRNVSATGEAVSYQVETVKPGTYSFVKENAPADERDLTVTVDGAVELDKRGKNTLSYGAAAGHRSQLPNPGELAAGESKTYMWKVTVPLDGNIDRHNIQIRTISRSEVDPWPIETDNCQPMLPTDAKTKPIIADGTEYDTGITVSNAEAQSDYERLTGYVYNGDKVIEGAKVRVDANGKVYVTVPKGATGTKDDGKPQTLGMKIYAQPREETNDSTYESYNSEQALRLADPQKPGSTNGDQEEFRTTVPVQKFTPKYKDPNSVKPGKSVKIDLANLTEKLRENKTAILKDPNTTFTPKNPAGGWAANIVDQNTGQLEVFAPAGAKGGDKVTVEVTVTYPDGSTDVLRPTVTVQDFDNVAFDPKYSEVKDVPGKTVTIKQTVELPEGTTFKIVPGQEWNPQVDPKTGLITVTIPGNAAPGTVKDILVDVTYPDESVDKQVPAKVTVLNVPAYGEETGKPGTEVKLPQTGKVAENTTFEIDPKQDLGKWEPTIDPKTGEITVVIPEGETAPKDIKVIVTDPNNKNNPETVVAKVTPILPPAYPETKTNPGTTIVVTPENTGKVPEGSTYTITPGQDLGQWEPTIDPKTGEITVVIPNDETDVTRDINVTVTYPNGKGEDTVPAKVIVTVPADAGATSTPATPEPTDKPTGKPTEPQQPGDDKTPGTPVTPGEGNTIVIVFPGTGIRVTPPATTKDPDGTKYEIKPGFTAPEGWTITINPSTGQLEVKVPENAKPGETITVPVVVTLPNGDSVTREVPVVVTPGNGGGITLPKDWKFDKETPTVIYVPVPVGAPDGDLKLQLPDGWTQTRDGNTIVITAPTAPTDGGGTIQIPGKDGDKVNITVTVDQGEKTDGEGATQEGSSNEEAKKCFTKLSTEPNSPLLWILPGAILLGVGAPLVGPLGQEVGKAIANVSAQMNIDIPNPWGNGGDNVRRENPVMATFNAEMARLNNTFGPQVAEAGLTALALLSLASLAGLLAWYCLEDGDTKLSSGMWDDVKAKQGEGSSNKGEASPSAEASAQPTTGASAPAEPSSAAPSVVAAPSDKPGISQPVEPTPTPVNQ